MTVAIDEDVTAAYDRLRPYIALYVGGMGAQEMNFHADVFRRLGYEEAVDKIQDLFLNGHQDDAIAAVPDAMVDEICLAGPKDKIRDDLAAWRHPRSPRCSSEDHPTRCARWPSSCSADRRSLLQWGDASSRRHRHRAAEGSARRSLCSPWNAAMPCA